MPYTIFLGKELLHPWLLPKNIKHDEDFSSSMGISPKNDRKKKVLCSLKKG